MQRRTVLAGIGATLGIGAIATSSQRARGVEINSLSVPNNTLETSQEITKLTLGVSGTYNFQTIATPTRVVLRLSLTHNKSQEQLTAKELGTIKTNTETSYGIEAPITSHSEISTKNINPNSIGDSVSLPLTVTITCEIYEEGRLLQEHSESVETTLEITKTTVSVTVDMNGTVNFDMTTAKP